MIKVFIINYTHNDRVPLGWKFTGKIRYIRIDDTDCNLSLEIQYETGFFRKKLETQWIPEYRFKIKEYIEMECSNA